MRKSRKIQAPALLVFGILGLSLLAHVSGETVSPPIQAQPKKQAQSASPQAAPGGQTQEKQSVENAKGSDKIVPAFRNIKERTAAYVFLGWIWVAVCVLIYILRQKVKEVDRLYKAKFFDLPVSKGED
jgi:hypothetical protein